MDDATDHQDVGLRDAELLNGESPDNGPSVGHPDEEIAEHEHEHPGDEPAGDNSSDDGAAEEAAWNNGPPDDEESNNGDSGDDGSDDASATSDNTVTNERGQPLVFDQDGDLRLVIGEGADQVSCIVCSKSMARASRVFKSMLFGGFAESKPQAKNAKWVVHLPEDDIGAMTVFLHLIHGQTHKVPGELARSDMRGLSDQEWKAAHTAQMHRLYHIAVVADKYHLTHVLKPWAQKWIEDFYDDDEVWNAKLTFIAWVLGDEWLVKKQLDLLMLTARFEGPELAMVGLEQEHGEVNLSDTNGIAAQVLGTLSLAGTLLTSILD